MELLDPRLGLVAAGTAIVGSERVRKAVGRGAGYVAAGAIKVGGPVVRPVIDAGRDIVDEARDVAVGDGSTRARGSRRRSASVS
jgi:hypothetical protein